MSEGIKLLTLYTDAGRRISYGLDVLPLRGYIDYIFNHLSFGCTDNLIIFRGRSVFFLSERKEEL
jgi:hypothetical protein